MEVSYEPTLRKERTGHILSTSSPSSAGGRKELNRQLLLVWRPANNFKYSFGRMFCSGAILPAVFIAVIYGTGH